MSRLFDVDTKQRRALAGNLPVLVGHDVCPECQAPATDVTYDEPALFIHGGYGATRRTVVRHCRRFCGWAVERERVERSPRAY